MTVASHPFAPPAGEIRRVLVALSGGVDSSVAIAKLLEEGHDVVGVTLHLWDAEGQQKVGRCCAPEDREDARATCDALGVRHYVFDERALFRETVVEPFLDDYAAGRTPSPCVHCNRTVKLLRLLDLADRLGCSHVATGHYAILRHDGDRVRLFRGKDLGKDQSYFLYGTPPEVLARMLFPLGAMTKKEVRDLAEHYALPNAKKGESQELCFVPDGDIRSFVQRERGETHRGKLIDEEGHSLGTHEGIEGFTIGQRKGLNLGGAKNPRYVLKILGQTNDVVVGDEQGLFASELTAFDVVWLLRKTESFRANVRIRYRHEPAAATVTPTESGISVVFDEPQRAITAGQALVVYDGDEVICGGFIQQQPVR